MADRIIPLRYGKLFVETDERQGLAEQGVQERNAPAVSGPLARKRVTSMHFIKMYQPTPMAYD